MPEAPVLRLRRLAPERDADLPLPHYATEGAAGMDVPAAVSSPVPLEPGRREAVPTGLELAVPRGHELQVRPRSGLALRHGVTVANAPGTIDADYRGELFVLLVNLGEARFTVERGLRVAQLVLAPVVRARVEPVDALETTPRGDGRFGHTGTR